MESLGRLPRAQNILCIPRDSTDRVTDRHISELQCEIDILAVSNATTTVSREVSLSLTWLLLGTKAVTPPHTHTHKENCRTALSSIRVVGRGDTVPGEIESREL